MAVAACYLTAWLVKLGWQARSKMRGKWQLCGVIAAVPPTILFLADQGPAAGLVTLSMALGMGGLCVTVQGAEFRSPRFRRERASESVSEMTPRAIGRGWTRGVAATILTLLAADCVCATLAGMIPGSAVVRFGTCALLAPILWAALVVWTLSDRVLLRPLAAMAGAMAASGVAITWILLT